MNLPAKNRCRQSFEELYCSGVVRAADTLTTAGRSAGTQGKCRSFPPYLTSALLKWMLCNAVQLIVSACFLQPFFHDRMHTNGKYFQCVPSVQLKAAHSGGGGGVDGRDSRRRDAELEHATSERRFCERIELLLLLLLLLLRIYKIHSLLMYTDLKNCNTKH